LEESSREKDQIPNQRSQENQLEDSATNLYHQKARKYMFRRNQPPRDKRLL
jgi:hypothetical protein